MAAPGSSWLFLASPCRDLVSFSSIIASLVNILREKREHERRDSEGRGRGGRTV
jgi:hypothetical protein